MPPGGVRPVTMMIIATVITATMPYDEIFIIICGNGLRTRGRRIPAIISADILVVHQLGTVPFENEIIPQTI